MKTLLNVVWLVLCGLWTALAYAVAGAVMCLLVVTIPWGIAAFRIASFTLWPFGRTAVQRPGAGVGSMLGNIVWLVLAGLWLAIGHVVAGAALCATIIGIPLGLANFKLVPISLMPLGREIVRTDQAYGVR